MEIWITGDCHGDFSRFTTDNFYEQKEMNPDEENYVIVCGDFGGVWCNNKEENYWLDWLDNKPFYTLFADGNHENFDLLNSYTTSEWNGGKVHSIRPHVIHLMRGQVYAIDGKSFFVFGGAASHDIKDGILDPDKYGKDFGKVYKHWRDQNKQFRVKGISWWEEEIPTKAEMNEGLTNLEKAGNKIDFIISHDADSFSLRQLDSFPYMYQTDDLNNYLFKIKENIDYGWHYFGHLHVNKNLYECRSSCIYEQIIRVV